MLRWSHIYHSVLRQLIAIIPHIVYVQIYHMNIYVKKKKYIYKYICIQIYIYVFIKKLFFVRFFGVINLIN